MHPTLTDNLWSLMRCCWDHDPSLRPKAPEVLQALTQSICERLIDQSLTAHERILLIKTIFSDNDLAKAIKDVSCDDAQTLINTTDKVSPRTI
jgi:hypothetical protein